MAYISHRALAEAVKRRIEREYPDWSVTMDAQPNEVESLTFWADGEKILEFGPGEPSFTVSVG